MEVMPGWGPYALAIQLLLVFFAPPLSQGTRSVFLTDVWCVLWLVPAVFLAFQTRKSKLLMRYFAITAILLGIVYVHGFWRPSVLAGLRSEYLFNLKETDLFQPGRELVVYLRFLSWLWAGGITCWWFSEKKSAVQRKAVDLLTKTLAGAVAGSAFLMLLERLSAGVHLLLSRIYGFDAAFTYWRSQAHGPFRSPVEAGEALGLSAILLIASRSSAPIVALGAAGSLIGVWLAHSMTSVVGLALVGGLYFSTRLPKRLRTLVPVACGIALIVLCVGLFHTNTFVEGKFRDLFFRAGPWRIYLSAMLTRWDRVLFGLGFAPYHCDNAYVFILTRGGLMLFGVSVWFARRMIYERWAGLPWATRSTILFLAFTSLALDAVIYRHVVMILVAAGFPILIQKGTNA